MLIPVTSEGCRSGVHWTRAKTASSMLRAIARASTVLPVPGTSSNRTWPWQVERGEDEPDLLALAAQRRSTTLSSRRSPISAASARRSSPVRPGPLSGRTAMIMLQTRAGDLGCWAGSCACRGRGRDDRAAALHRWSHDRHEPGEGSRDPRQAGWRPARQQRLRRLHDLPLPRLHRDLPGERRGHAGRDDAPRAAHRGRCRGRLDACAGAGGRQRDQVRGAGQQPAIATSGSSSPAPT